MLRLLPPAGRRGCGCRPRAVLLALVLLACAPLRSEAEEPGAALGRLTPQERRVLEERVPDFDRMDPQRQERIAANVIRLRGLDGEARARLRDRLRALERRRDEQGRLPSGLEAARTPTWRETIRRRGALVRGVGTRMWASLDPDARRRITATLGRRGRGAVEVAFTQRVLAEQARALAASLAVIELPDGLPPRVERRVAPLRERAEAGDAKARLHLAQLAVVVRAQGWVEEFPASGRVERETLEAVGEAVRASAPDVFAAAVADLERATAGAARLGALRARRRGRRAGPKDPRLVRLRKALDEARPALEADPRLRGPAERLEGALEQALERAR